MYSCNLSALIKIYSYWIQLPGTKTIYTIFFVFMSFCWCEIKMFCLNWITSKSIRHIDVIIYLSHYALMASLLTEMSFCVVEIQMETHRSAPSWLNIASPEGTATIGLFLALMLSNACEAHSKWNAIFFPEVENQSLMFEENVRGFLGGVFVKNDFLMYNKQSLYCLFIYLK